MIRYYILVRSLCTSVSLQGIVEISSILRCMGIHLFYNMYHTSDIYNVYDMYGIAANIIVFICWYFVIVWLYFRVNYSLI